MITKITELFKRRKSNTNKSMLAQNLEINIKEQNNQANQTTVTLGQPGTGMARFFVVPKCVTCGRYITTGHEHKKYLQKADNILITINNNIDGKEYRYGSK